MHRRVVWQQGMLVTPQHFQQQELAVQHMLRRSILQPRSINWGITSLVWDEGALQAGALALNQCEGLFHSGQHFAAPDVDRLPPPLTPTSNQVSQDIFLALPVAQPRLARVGPESPGAETPEISTTTQVWDDSTPEAGRAPTEITTSRYNLRLFVGAEPPQGMHAIRIGRIQTISAAGNIALDERCWPVAYCSRSSAPLLAYVRDIAPSLYQRSRDTAGFAARVGSFEMLQELLFLSCINRAATVMAQVARLPEIHPYDLYLLIVGIASELHTFGPKSKSAPEYPAYNHLDQRACFLPPFEDLRRALDRPLPKRATCLPLTDGELGIWRASFPDAGVLKPGTRLLLSIVAPGSPAKAREIFPKVATVAGTAHLTHKLDHMASGMTLQALMHEPAEVQNPNPRAIWFEISVPSDDWKTLINGIGVYISRQIPDLSMELWILTRDTGDAYGAR